MWDAIWVDADLATMVGDRPYGAIPDGAIGISGGLIAWVGPRDALEAAPERCARRVHSAGRRWITPGLIDCHSHVVFAGERSRDFEIGIGGGSYAQAQAAGGGMPSTLKATRAASDDELFALARNRLRVLMREGMTTTESKSGYGLDLETEIKQLRVGRRLGRELPLRVVNTFLGAHNVPPEYADRGDAYMAFVIGASLPAAHESGLVDIVDVALEHGWFTTAQAELLFRAAQQRGLPTRAHTDQFRAGGGAEVVARHNGLSADHLEYVSRAGADAMAAAGTVAVMLPGANYTVREKQVPPIDWFRDAGVPMAVATNCNPGTSPATSLLMMMNMAATLFRMMPEEVLAGVTREAARALGLSAICGTLEVGKAADLAVWSISRPAELVYWIGYNPCSHVVKAGEIVHAAETTV